MASRYKTEYLDKFGTVKYDFTGQNDYVIMTNFTKYISITDISDISSYIFYDIPENERPDMSSYNIYGDPKYYWTFFLINDHLRNGLSAWPLSNYEMDLYIQKEYDPYCWISSHHDANTFSILHNVILDDKYLPALEIEYHNEDFNVIETFKPKKYDAEKFGLITYKEPIKVIDTNSNEEIINPNYIPKFFGSDALGAPNNSIDIMSLKIKHDGSALGFEWQEKMNKPGYWQTTDFIIDPETNIYSYDFYINLRLSNVEYKNATYQYYVSEQIITINNPEYIIPRTSFSHYDILKQLPEPGFLPYPGLVDIWNRLSQTEKDKIILECKRLKDGVVPFTPDDESAYILINNIPFITFEEYEKQLNDSKRRVRIMRPELIDRLIKKYFTLLES